MNMTTNPQIIEPLYFLREREVVHYQRFGECHDILQKLQGCGCGCGRGCNCNAKRRAGRR